MIADPWSIPDRLLETLRTARNPVLFTHVYPDGDGVGSELGLARALRGLGQEARILNTHPAPEKFRFLDPDGQIDVLPGGNPSPEQLALVKSADVLIILDTADPGRLGRLQQPVFEAPGSRVVIDHHLCEDADRFDATWSVPSSPATGNLIVRLLEELEVALTPEIAVPLFVAIGTDTGWFRFANATGPAFRQAARLVEAGADPERIYSRIFESFSVGRTRLLGELLSDVHDEEDGRIIYGVIRGEALARHGVQYEEIDGLIDSLKSIQGGEILILVVELSPQRYKVSLRSKGERNVHPIATHFGGGGHAKASGCRLEGGEQEVIDRVLEVARSTLSTT